MAWQLHYTSARRGPTGRAGFQFVAETPGLPDGMRAAVTPYLSYRPPPDAPLSPDDSELGLFPVSLLYEEVDGRPLLLRCRYLGRDYSGRYGNFFAHAVVAEPEELEGLRPAELWHAAHWTPLPAPGTVLDPLDELTPGAALDPEALAAWLATAGPDDPYALLASLVDAVAGVLAQGHGRVVLIAGDVELIARWIAVVSYSLPVAAAARLSFVTYTADPDGAAQRLVGTTPAVWSAAQSHASHASAFDLRTGVPGGAASRFARTVAGCWRTSDFGGLDALGELAPLNDPAQEGAAALLAMCRGDATVTADEEDAAAELLSRRGSGIPDWVWRDLVPGVPSMGLDLALALHDRAPAELRDAVLDGVVDGLADAGPAALTSALTSAHCDRLYGHRERLRDVPAVAVPVLASIGRRHRSRRIAVTGELLRLDGADIEGALREIWAAPPSAAECVDLLDAHGLDGHGRPAVHPALAELPSRTFTRLAFPGGDGLADPATLRLAERAGELMPGERAGRDAELVQAYGKAITAGPSRAARALERIAGADGATPQLAGEAFAGAARRLFARPPGFRAELLAALSAAGRARLAAQWTDGLPGRTRAGRAPLRGAEIERRNELVEVVLRLRKRGVTEPSLEAWARAAAGRWLAAKQLDSHLARRPELRAELRDLLAEEAP
ncbi:hypothetical protein E1293_22300 [Actinomadura darangshiensis]|uniref:Uncharacterized protein n=1 Tax=Actinomadura darangshiensis TaxID=705336 RepID=A0A4R5B840_9ACTN|nr:hypothetical protein [Actinomadura darangshiensis]TDD79844.1 hypothetical protein E1293_22300 [Actinomadura darangshiensis]